MSETPSSHQTLQKDEALGLGQLMATRLCHDLAGAIGAVSQGAELLGMDPDSADAETIGLVASSADAVAIKLKVLRAAFGWSGSGDVNLADMAGLMQSYLAVAQGRPDTGVVVKDGPQSLTGLDHAFGADSAALVLNALILAYELRPLTQGLEITVADSPAALTVTNHALDGRSDAPRTELLAAATGGEAALSPMTVQAVLTCRLAKSAGVDLTVKVADTHLTVSLLTG